MFDLRDIDTVREAVRKKTADFEDVGMKGGWVLISKPNFFT